MSEKESYATSRWTLRKLTFLVLLAVSLLLFIQSQNRAVSLNKSQRLLQKRSTLPWIRKCPMINIHLKISSLGSWRCQLHGCWFVAHIGNEKTYSDSLTTVFSQFNIWIWRRLIIRVWIFNLTALINRSVQPFSLSLIKTNRKKWIWKMDSWTEKKKIKNTSSLQQQKKT